MAENVAEAFSTSRSYASGDLTIYGGDLYRFTVSHPAGAWNGAHAARVDDSTQEDLTRILAGTENAEKASDYVDTVVFAPAQMMGTRYKYTLTSAADPRV